MQLHTLMHLRRFVLDLPKEKKEDYIKRVISLAEGLHFKVSFKTQSADGFDTVHSYPFTPYAHALFAVYPTMNKRQNRTALGIIKSQMRDDHCLYRS